MGAPLEQVDVPYIVRRINAGVPNGKGGYTDAVTDVAVYYGRSREAKRNVDPTDLSNQGETALTSRIVVFDIGPMLGLSPMNVGESDLLIEGMVVGNSVVENPNGEKFEIENVRRYDRTTQINCKAIDV